MTLASFFLRPPAADGPVHGEEVRWLAPADAGQAVACAAVAVVCAPRDARVAGCAAALALAHQTRAPAVTVLEWTGAEQRPPQDRPAVPAARRLAARRRQEGAVAAGRLVRIPLAADEHAAASQAHALLLDTDTPAVLVASGPRRARMDDLVDAQARIVLVARPGDDDELVALAAQRLRAAPVVLATSPGAAALARAGAALVAPLRAPFLDALR